MMHKLKFVQNSATLGLTNTGLDAIIFGPEEVLGILDLRSLGNYKIKQIYYNKFEVNTTDLKRQMFCENNLINL